MTTPLADAIEEQVLYPDSDGQPMAENTLQYQWIVTIQGNLDDQYRNDANVFVAGDLLWYAVEGQPTIRVAPDVMVAFGRPKGYRGSYKQWRERGVAPQVVFEILSPGNRPVAMGLELEFYRNHNVDEYYIYDPDNIDLLGYLRTDGELLPIANVDGWVSPRLGIRFDMSGPELVIWRSDGQKFLTFLEQAAERESAQERALQAQELTQQAQERAQQAQERAHQAQANLELERRQREDAQVRAERFAARLRELGIDPES
jgi:Uma2 family endonuclease